MSEGLRPVVVLDFGGQYCHLIANRIRRLGFYSEIKLPETTAEELRKLNAAGLILSGGGGSVYEQDLKADPKILDLGIPVLGICYGMQWLAHHIGGEVKPGKVKEYGKVELELIGNGGDILDLGEKELTVWMSHGDEVVTLPPDFEHIASSAGCKNIAMRHRSKPIWALQFHPEVTHTPRGKKQGGRRRGS